MVFSAGALATMALFALPAFQKTGMVSAADAIHGKWSSQFEKNFNEVIPMFEPSRALWGSVEYALFRQGRKGVIVGNDGWLFTDEEFSCPPHTVKNRDENFAYIQKVRDKLTQNNVQLAVTIVPAKSRVYPDHLGNQVMPACRAALYGDAIGFLDRLEIRHTDLLPIMRATPGHEQLYLRTDTHWSDQGARLAAQQIAQMLKDFKFEKKQFKTSKRGQQEHKGDLLRYMPGVDAIEPDQIAVVSTDATGTDNALFDDAVPAVTLVGTSYSANPLWNFEGYLKESLQTDVLNMADEGLGPFTVMDKYLENAAWRNNPPRLVIWEIPERYLVMPHDIKSNQPKGHDEKKPF